MAKVREDLSSGKRVYVETRYGEPIVAALKSLGCHWDREAKCWWIGAAKRSDLETLLKSEGAAFDLRDPVDRAVRADQLEDAGRTQEAAQVRVEPLKEDVSDCRVYAQVEYKGRRYYVIAETKDLTRCRLTTLDGMAPFWADCSACNLIRRYEAREVWDGRRYSGRTRTEYQTIGGLRRFRDKQQRARADGEPACASCGKHGQLHHDLEDGLIKCRGCCDIPE